MTVTGGGRRIGGGTRTTGMVPSGPGIPPLEGFGWIGGGEELAQPIFISRFI